MIVIYLKAGEKPELKEIDGSLESMQGLVGGLIERYFLPDDDYVVICNEEGKINGLPPTMAVMDEDGLQEVICGNCFICRNGEYEFEGLNLDDVLILTAIINPVALSK